MSNTHTHKLKLNRESIGISVSQMNTISCIYRIDDVVAVVVDGCRHYFFSVSFIIIIIDFWKSQPPINANFVGCCCYFFLFWSSSSTHKSYGTRFCSLDGVANAMNSKYYMTMMDGVMVVKSGQQQ